MTDSQLGRLRAALVGQRCVSVKLGYSDVLFVSFGDENAVAKLDTNFAAWRVDGDVSAEWSDGPSGSSRAELQVAADSLVGETVIDCELMAANCLRVTLTHGKHTTIEPWPAEDGISDAWSLLCPDGQILAVANDGRVAVVAADVPTRDWFARSAE